jgi:hypothetical protein
LGNAGNALLLEDAATFDVINFFLSSDNTLSIEGDFTLAADLLTFLDDTLLQVENSEDIFEAITLGNFSSLITTSFDGQYTMLQAVPEPSTYALIMAAMGLAYTITRRRK